MSKPDLVAILDFATWFAVEETKKKGTYDCGEDLPGCNGALWNLCARNMTGGAAVGAWWGFEDCFFAQQHNNGDAKNMTTNAAACAAAAKIDAGGLAACASGALGQALLAETAVQTLAPPAVVWTPWFVINNAVPGGGKQPIEIDYLKEVCSAYTGTPPESCDDVGKGA
jgi:hypothetical protein